MSSSKGLPPFPTEWWQDDRPALVIADSCAGGLSVLEKLLPLANGYKVLYLADSEFNPFGLRSESEISGIVSSWIMMLEENHQHPDSLIIIGCNTASIAISRYPPALSRVPGFGYISLTRAMERLAEDIKRLGLSNTVLLGTRYTVNSGHYNQILSGKGNLLVTSLEASITERTVARGYHRTTDGIREVHQELSRHASESTQAVVLGCTCFKYVTELLRKLFPNACFFDPVDYLIDDFPCRSIAKMPAYDMSNVLVSTSGEAVWANHINVLANIIFGEPFSVKGSPFVKPRQPNLPKHPG